MSSDPDLQSRHFRASDGVMLHYLEVGSGPPLVFVPGLMMPAEIWEPQLRAFAETHRAVAFDPRGQGRSEKPTYGYHPSRRALDISELLQHLGDPAVVVGWSLGMQELLVLVHEFGTEGIRGVVLIDHPIVIDPVLFKPYFVSLQVERDEWTRRFVRECFRSRQSEEYLTGMTRAVLGTPTSVAAVLVANLMLIGPTDLRAAMDSLDRPAVYLSSSEEWAAVAAEQVRTGYPRVPVKVIAGAGHALFVDRPDEFNAVVEEFLASLPD